MLGIIGCGNMGQAFIRGLRSKAKGIKLIAFDTDRRKLRSVGTRYGIKSASDLSSLVSVSGAVIIAVKPQDITCILPCLKENFHDQLVISIAAGVSTSFIGKKVSKKARVVRAMPNLAATIGRSVSFYCKGRLAKAADAEFSRKVFSSVGEVFLVKESFIDKVTSISGSGPGYVYYMMDCVYKSAKKFGFKKKEAKRMVALTFQGAADLACRSEKDFGRLVKEVASPGGTTEAALKVFEKKKLAAAIAQGIKAAYRRAGQISKRPRGQ